MKKKSLESHEKDLFRATIGNVTEIKKDKVLLTSDKKPKPYPQVKKNDIEQRLNHGRVTHEIETIWQEDSMSFVANQSQHILLKKLKQGYFDIDAEMDLHGLTSYDAKRQLLVFLHHCVENGCRCVHIIHGKGYRSFNNMPVLKNNLNLWLRQHKDVQAFCSASAKDGGTGAVLVLLYVSSKYNEEN